MNLYFSHINPQLLVEEFESVKITSNGAEIKEKREECLLLQPETVLTLI